MGNCINYHVDFSVKLVTCYHACLGLLLLFDHPSLVGLLRMKANILSAFSINVRRPSSLTGIGWRVVWGQFSKENSWFNVTGDDDPTSESDSDFRRISWNTMGCCGELWARKECVIDRVLRCHQLRDATFFVRKRVIYLACQIWEHEIWSDNFDQRAVVSTDQGLILLMNFAHKPLFIIHDRCITVWIQLHTIYAKLAEIVFQFQEWKANLEKISLPYHSL